MDANAALGCIAVVLEFEAVVMLRVGVFWVVRWRNLERCETKGGSLEVNECLQGGGRGIGLPKHEDRQVERYTDGVPPCSSISSS